MSAPPQPPSQDELAKRRQPVYHIDPQTVNNKEEERAKSWAMEVMRKNEFRLDTTKWKVGQIIWSGEPKPEDVDIQQIYPFPKLRWIIYRGGPIIGNRPPFSTDNCFSIMLLSGNKLLFTTTCVKI